tara:strand:+ start:25761 stop:25916 length:156 start_codon:yes stop_codon:yes gene_type:complete
MASLSANYYKGLEKQPQFVTAKKRLVCLLRKQAKLTREIERLNKILNRKDQ